MTSISTALLFLINTVFDLYIFVLTVRLLLAWVQANYNHPLTQFIIKLTQPLVGPLRRIVPNVKNLESATLLLIVILEIIKFFLIAVIIHVHMPHAGGLLILACADIAKFILNTFFYAILAQVILSWVQPHSPANYLLYQITSPIMRPLKRLIPPISGVDITPVFAIIILQFLIILLVSPLMKIGIRITFG